MSFLQSDVKQSASGFLSRHAIVLLAFASTLFVSALLLFGVQPLFARMVLPKLGGSPAVWSVALVFFQAMLLLGYAYAHALTVWFKPRTAILIHLVTMTLAMLCLPLSYPENWVNVPETGQVFWVLGLFAAGVGFPFFAISANAPLLQSWFAKTGHPHSADPYFLYGASNIGSFCALFLYPFVFEPLLTLPTQSLVWSVGYGILAVMIAVCGYVLHKVMAAQASHSSQNTEISTVDTAAQTAPCWRDRAIWVGLAMVPSGLLVGVTAFITTDLVAAPFLWVLPLALFLLTFVITFQRNPVLPHGLMLKVQSFVLAPLALLMFTGVAELFMVVLHLVAFFVSAMVCHGELVRRRPGAQHLTEFYLWMSVGGVLGGLFASLLAPQIFNDVFEYPILFLAAFLCRRDVARHFAEMSVKNWWPFGIALLLLAGLVVGPVTSAVQYAYFSIAVLLIAATVLLRNNAAMQAGCVAAGLILVTGISPKHEVVTQVRSFFGVNAVKAFDGGQFHVLTHGSTIHGAERRFNADGTPVTGKPVPLAYYYQGGPLETAVAEVRQANGGLENVAVIGLGTGAMACHRQAGENWRYFEIDPEVIKLARDPRYFRFLSECGESGGIVIGDGRITLEREAAKKFDVIVLDAFSSDSIPAHLITREAMELYFTKLKPGGSLVFHISNRYLELASVVTSVAKEVGAETWISRRDKKIWHVNEAERHGLALVAVVTRSPQTAGTIVTDKRRWFQLRDDELSAPWSDNYANVLGAIIRSLRHGIVPARTLKVED